MARLGYYSNSGKHSYQCSVCLKIHVYSTSARDCCYSQKPNYVNQEIDLIIKSKPIPEPKRPTPRTKAPKDGIYYKDRWGHWRRGIKHSKLQTFSDYNRAFESIDQEAKDFIIKRLESLYPSYTLEAPTRAPRTALQDLAQAWHYHNWEAAKAALLRAASEAAVDQQTKASIETFKPELMIDEILKQAESYLKRKRGKHNDTEGGTPG